MRRFAVPLALALVIGTPAASRAATEASEGCAVFPWVQTYRTWGPAAHYGARVTVVYEAEGCQESQGSLLVSGTATVHLGRSDQGQVLDIRPFANVASWSGDNFVWWSCVDAAAYAWEIEDVYRFEASATAGAWILSVDPGPQGPLEFTHQAC